MPDEPKKKPPIRDVVASGGRIADEVKEFTPPEVDVIIDRGKQAAGFGAAMFDMVKGLFKKKKK